MCRRVYIYCISYINVCVCVCACVCVCVGKDSGIKKKRRVWQLQVFSTYNVQWTQVLYTSEVTELHILTYTHTRTR